MNTPKYSKDSFLKCSIFVSTSFIFFSRSIKRKLIGKYCLVSLYSLSLFFSLLGDIGLENEAATKMPLLLQSSIRSWNG